MNGNFNTMSEISRLRNQGFKEIPGSTPSICFKEEPEAEKPKKRGLLRRIFGKKQKIQEDNTVEKILNDPRIPIALVFIGDQPTQVPFFQLQEFLHIQLSLSVRVTGITFEYADQKQPVKPIEPLV